MLDKIRTQYHLEAHGIKPATKKPLVIGAVVAVLAIGIAGYLIATQEPTTIREGETEEQRQERLRVHREGKQNELTQYVTIARGELQNIEGRKLGAGALNASSWEKKIWRTLEGDYKTLAGEMKATLDGWKKEAASEEDAEIQGYYRDKGAELEGLITDANQRAEALDKKLTGIQKNAAAIKQARGKAIADLEVIKKHAEKLRAYVTSGAYADYVELEKGLRPDFIKDLYQALLDKKVAGETLLEFKEGRQAAARQAPPGGRQGRGHARQAVAGPGRQAHRRLERAEDRRGQAGPGLEAHRGRATRRPSQRSTARSRRSR